MIKSIELYNFQNHKKLKVKFDPYGLNIIIGETGEGKSAIFRALFLVTDNKPSGADRLFQSPKYKIIVKTETHTIIREPKKYTLIDEDDNKEEFIKFGTDVPDKIRKALPLKDANWQRQLSRHFLLFESPGIAAKMINNISGVSDQEKILNEIKSKIFKTKTDFTYWSTVKEESKQTISKLENIGEYYNLLLELQEKQKLIIQKDWNVEKLDEILNQISIFEQQTNRMRTVTQIENLLKILEDKAEELNRLQNKILEIDRTLRKLEDLSLTKDPTKFINQIEKLERKAIDIQTKEDRLQDLGKTLKFLNQNVIKMKGLEENIDDYNLKFKLLMRELKICPLCEQRIKI
jgi:DNA repair ATPase RecN